MDAEAGDFHAHALGHLIFVPILSLQVHGR